MTALMKAARERSSFFYQCGTSREVYSLHEELRRETFGWLSLRLKGCSLVTEVLRFHEHHSIFLAGSWPEDRSQVGLCLSQDGALDSDFRCLSSVSEQVCLSGSCFQCLSVINPIKEIAQLSSAGHFSGGWDNPFLT